MVHDQQIVERLRNALQDLLDACEHWENQNDPVLKEAREALAAVREAVAADADDDD